MRTFVRPRILRTICTNQRAFVLSTLGIVTGCAFLGLRHWGIRTPLLATMSNSTPPLAMAIRPAAPRTHRILCYGDSLTAGTSGWDLYPYAPYLEQGLRQLRGDTIAVRHRGNPGMTAAEMVQDLDGPRRGLRSAIQAVTNPSLSLVILLAGTNDMAYAAPANIPSAADEISGHLMALHAVCAELGVTRTIAIGVPPSGYQYRNENARNLANMINDRLEQYAIATNAAPNPISKETNQLQVTFMPFPFPYEPDGENWNSDTLHFSETGYRVLGEALVPVVDSILQALDGVEEEGGT